MLLLWDQVKKDLVKFEKLIGFTKWLYSEVSFNLILVSGSNHTLECIGSNLPTNLPPNLCICLWLEKETHAFSKWWLIMLPCKNISPQILRNATTNNLTFSQWFPDENKSDFLQGLPGTCSNLPRRRNQSLLRPLRIGHMDVSENNGTPKSSNLIGISIINHIFWGPPIFGNTHIEQCY